MWKRLALKRWRAGAFDHDVGRLVAQAIVRGASDSDRWPLQKTAMGWVDPVRL